MFILIDQVNKGLLSFLPAAWPYLIPLLCEVQRMLIPLPGASGHVAHRLLDDVCGGQEELSDRCIIRNDAQAVRETWLLTSRTCIQAPRGQTSLCEKCWSDSLGSETPTSARAAHCSTEPSSFQARLLLQT